MIQVTGIVPIFASRRGQYNGAGYRMPEKDDSFSECMKNEDTERSMTDPRACEEELQLLWKELAGDCTRLNLQVHPNVYVGMSEDPDFGIRIRERLSGCFLEQSMLHAAITLARLDAGDVYIRIAHNGDLTYSKESS